jgi:hypothetical protein
MFFEISLLLLLLIENVWTLSNDSHRHFEKNGDSSKKHVGWGTLEENKVGPDSLYNVQLKLTKVKRFARVFY